YFVDSASAMIGASVTASRWVEIETRIRDTHGLSAAQLRCLKAVGILNLVATAGALRASREVLHLALVDGCDGTASGHQVDGALASLEEIGLVTYREFA